MKHSPLVASYDDKITFLSCGNGDSILMESQGSAILTDINYRGSHPLLPSGGGHSDPRTLLKQACPYGRLNLFVLSHPDQDHTAGFETVFHTGNPWKWKSGGADKTDRILIDEIWCTSAALNGSLWFDTNSPVFREIRRRRALSGKDPGRQAGNRLTLLDTLGTQQGALTPSLQWQLLYPFPHDQELSRGVLACAPQMVDTTSLVIRWTIVVNGFANHVLLGGDAPVEIWEKIHDSFAHDAPTALEWHLLLAPHHCARRSIGRVYSPTGRVLKDGNRDQEFLPSSKAIAALEHQIGRGYVVSSCGFWSDHGKAPPSRYARHEYERILAGHRHPTPADRSRFVCTGGECEEEGPAHLVFCLTSDGPTPPTRLWLEKERVLTNA